MPVNAAKSELTLVAYEQRSTELRSRAQTASKSRILLAKGPWLFLPQNNENLSVPQTDSLCSPTFNWDRASETRRRVGNPNLTSLRDSVRQVVQVAHGSIKAILKRDLDLLRLLSDLPVHQELQNSRDDLETGPDSSACSRLCKLRLSSSARRSG